jgi:hypothetical protein
VGPETGSFAQFEPEREEDNARRLRAALASEPGERRTRVGAVEELHESAAAVTRRIEQANDLARAAAEGRLLEQDALINEVDALLDLLGRLDRAGRFGEELRLARALHGLLVLSFRWLELVHSLRSTLQAARTGADEQGEAWALHELGSLQLCAGQPETAVESLGKALQLEERLGDATGRCATRHNLDCARRDLALRAVIGGRSRRLLRLTGLVTILALLGGGGAAIALALGENGHDSATPSAIAAPAVTIESGPDDPTEETSAVFTFTGSPEGLAYTCSLDGNETPCESTSKQTYADLSPGPHTFKVTVTDAQGRSDTGSYSWTITPPPIPDLTVSLGEGTYTVINIGDADAGPFTVVIADDGQPVETVENPSGLAAGQDLAEQALPCVNGTVTITADAANAVAESDENNNSTSVEYICVE